MKTLLKCRIQIAVDWLLRQITDCLIRRPAQLCSCGTLINRSTLAYFPIPEVFINHFIDIFYEAVNCGFSKFFKKEKKISTTATTIRKLNMSGRSEKMSGLAWAFSRPLVPTHPDRKIDAPLTCRRNICLAAAFCVS